MIEFNVPDEASEALQRLLDLGADGIESLRAALEATGPALLPVRTRAILVDEHMGGDQADAIQEILTFAVQPLLLLRQQGEITATEIHTAVSKSLEGDYASKWTDFKSNLIALLKSDILNTEAKASSLLRARPNVIQSMRVFSDARPVFDDSRDIILANALGNTLRIRFRDGDDSKVIHFSLDPRGLDDLDAQIQRAKKKNEKITEMSRAADIPLLTFESPSSDSLSDTDDDQ